MVTISTRLFQNEIIIKIISVQLQLIQLLRGLVTKNLEPENSKVILVRITEELPL
jgi:hypothetical protein